MLNIQENERKALCSHIPAQQTQQQMARHTHHRGLKIDERADVVLPKLIVVVWLQDARVVAREGVGLNELVHRSAQAVMSCEPTSYLRDTAKGMMAPHARC